MNTTLARLRRAAWLQALALALLTPSLVFVTAPVRANPAGGVVTHGAAEIGDGLNGHLQVIQNSNRAVINWESFNIAAGEHTQFVQPGANALMLSKVMSGNPSALHGLLSANGGHILVNPNGILVGASGRVDVGGMNVLSTLDIDSNQFMRGGPMRFTGNTTAGVTNFGTVTSAGGDVILLGNFVDNQGKLGAVNGTVALGAGGEILIGGEGDHTISILRGGPGGGTGVNNAGTITGASVEMKAHGNVYALAVNNTGAVRATGGGRSGGRVILSAPGGSINNTGTITAQKANGAGGEILIDATGGDVNIEDGRVSADGNGGRPGGTVTVLADTIGVGANATVSANGGSGGTVILGGDGTSLINVDGSVEAKGSSGVGGTIQLLGDPSSVINVNGGATLDASGSTSGGLINVQGGTFNAAPNSMINAGGGLNGGVITIDAQGVNTLGGMIQASGDAQKGGDVTLTGEEVNLIGNAVVDVSGALGGGNANIGGGFQGRVDTIKNATTTRVGPGVRIDANSTLANNAGNVVVWADGDTTYSGDITANALGLNGNGGLIEVSGKDNLTVRGTVSAMSVNGQSGAVLFDPGDVVVGNADDATVDIDSEVVNMTLQGGTSVIIATESGDITFLNTGVDNDWHDAIEWTNSNASFGAFASGLIDIKTHIRTSGRGSINLMAGWTGSEADLAGFGYADNGDGTFSNALGIPTVEIAWRFFLEAGQFGDKSQLGAIIMGGGSTNRHVSVGSRYGNTNVAGGDLFMIAPQNNVSGSEGTPETRFIQLGFTDNGQTFRIRNAGGFDAALLDLNDRLLERNNDPIVGINNPLYYRDIGTDGIADGVYAINSGGLLDATNAFAIANPGGQDAGPATLIPFANHFTSSRIGNWWWQQIDGLSPDPQGLGGLAPEHGAGRDPNVTGDPTSRADINVALTGGLLQQSGGRHDSYNQIGHGGGGSSWADGTGLRDGNRNNNLSNQSGRNHQYNAGRDWSGTGIGRLAGVFGNINILAGVDPTTVRYDASNAEINLTGTTDNQGGFVRLESWQNTASANNLNNPEQGNNSESWVQIGHLGDANFGYVEGDINVSAGGNIEVLAGAHTRNHATIGHTHNGFVIWNPPANEHAQIRFAYDLGDNDNPNTRKGELFLHANGVDFARGFYADDTQLVNVDGIAGNDPGAGRWDDDFWDVDGDRNNDGLLDSDGITPVVIGNLAGPGVTGTLGEHPDGPVHVPALTGTTRKDLIGDIRVNSYGPGGITIKGFSNPDTRTITTDDSRTVGDLYDDVNGNGIQDPGEASRAPGAPAFFAMSGARGANVTDDGSDDDGLRFLRDRRFAGIGHGGSGFNIWADLDNERVRLRVTAGDITDTGGINPVTGLALIAGETQGNVNSASVEAIGSDSASRVDRGVTFVNMLGDIEVHAHNGGVVLASGNDTFDYAYIGHGGSDFADYESSHVTIGNITVTGDGNLTMLGSGVTTAFTGEVERTQRSQAQIGHHGYDTGTQFFGGDILVDFTGDIDMVGSRLGYSPVKIGHQTFRSFGQVGGTYERHEQFFYGPQIPESATVFTGATVTDSTVIIEYGPDVAAADFESTYAISGNTTNIDVRSGGNIVMTHADPNLAVTQNMYARRQGNGINNQRWSATAIGHGGRETYAFRTNADNLLYWFKDKSGNIDVQAGSFEVELDPLTLQPILDANGDEILVLDANGNPVVESGTGDITLQNGSFEGWITNIGHYFHDVARSNAPVTAENAYRLIGDINVNAYNNLTMDSSFASANDPVNFASFIGLPIAENQVRIGHGADYNNLDISTVNDGSDVNGIAASSNITLAVGNDFNMGYLRTTDGDYEGFKNGLEAKVGGNFFIFDDDPILNNADEANGGYYGVFSQVGHGYQSDLGNDPARPNGFEGNIAVMVGNDMNMIAGEDSWLVSPVLGDGPIFIEGHAAIIGNGGHKLDSDLRGDIGVYVANNLTMTAQQRKQLPNLDSSQNPIGSVGHMAKIGHWSLDMDVIGSNQSIEGNHSGSITVVVGNNLEMNGGQVPDTNGDSVIDETDFIAAPTQFAFTQIGHSAPGVNGDKEGDIQVLVGNNFTTNDGVTGPNANAYVMVGNGDWARDGAGFAGHGGSGPGSRTGDIAILVGNNIDFDHTLIGHADPAVIAAETTIRSGNTFIGVSRNFPFFDTAPGAADATGGNFRADNSIFTSGFYGLNGELRIYMPQRENNLIELNTRLNEGFISYLGTPQSATVNGVGGVSFVDHLGGTFDSTRGSNAGRPDELYLQPDLWWDADMLDTIAGIADMFPATLADVQGGSVATVGAPGGIPNLVLLSAGIFGDGTALDASPLDYQIANGLSGRGNYTIYYDAIEEVDTTVLPPIIPPTTPTVEPPTPPLPPNPGNPLEPFFVEPLLPAVEIVDLGPLFDLFGLLQLVDGNKFDAYDRYPEDAFWDDPDSEGFWAGIGLYGLIYGPNGELAAEENIEVSTGNAFLDTLGMLVGFETSGLGAAEAEEAEKKAARYRKLGRLWITQYRQLLNTGPNRYNSANVFSGNGL